jgi:palmitoyl-protein thioesterase
MFLLVIIVSLLLKNALAEGNLQPNNLDLPDLPDLLGYKDKFDYDKYYDIPTPIVLLHGITSDTKELAPVVEWLQSRLPNPIYNIEIGNGRANSLFKTMDWQLNELCMAIYAIPQLEAGFHFIGMSQGGLLARGYVQRCNRYPVRNLITWVSPQAGVYGFNDVFFDWKKIYMPGSQARWSFAGYWKNPYQYDVYITNSSFLPYLNNESPYHAEYGNHGFNFYQNRERIESLENFVMIWSAVDDVISPPQSGKFEFYDIQGCQELITKGALQVKDFFESPQYVDNLLGLRTLFHSGKLHMLETNCTHSGHKTPACFPQLEELTFPFLT